MVIGMWVCRGCDDGEQESSSLLTTNVPNVVSPPSIEASHGHIKSSGRYHDESSTKKVAHGESQKKSTGSAHRPPAPPKTAFMCFSDAKTGGNVLSKESLSGVSFIKSNLLFDSYQCNICDCCAFYFIYLLLTQNVIMILSRLQTKNNLKLVADQWRQLSSREKVYWEEKAREDKRRYLKGKDEGTQIDSH